MNHSCSVLYSFALIVYRSVLRRMGSPFALAGDCGGDGYGSWDAIEGKNQLLYSEELLYCNYFVDKGW